MKKLLLGTVALIAIAGTASAADLRMPVKAPPVIAPVFSWTGCYIGGYVGGAWAGNDAAAYDYGVSGVANGFANSAYNNFYDHGWSYKHDSSFIGGGTVGCNWQPVGSPWVLGLEGEIGYMSISGSAIDPVARNAAGLGLDTVASSKIGDWYGMITGRLGYAFDRALIYVKGGVAFVDTEWSVVDGCTTGTCSPWTVNAGGSSTKATWTVGGGLEYAFDMNWSIKAEYMFIGLDETETSCGTAVGPTANPFCFSHDLPGIHTAKVGLNYRFGGARY
ncbi:outer membrane protein [Rhodoplanes sp. SY1]|uniref:outer membrane protein n=1 Tax=Rhodoplanes sp. SY1 TaxID=3166646 RepID=UPI0038B55C21